MMNRRSLFKFLVAAPLVAPVVIKAALTEKPKRVPCSKTVGMSPSGPLLIEGCPNHLPDDLLCKVYSPEIEKAIFGSLKPEWRPISELGKQHGWKWRPMTDSNIREIVRRR